MKRSITTYGVTFAAVGAVVAIALLAYDYLLLNSPSGISTASPFDGFTFVALCPPSIALMALERVHGAKLLFGLFLIVLMNAGFYFVGGSLVGALAWAGKQLVGRVGPPSN
jgi:hypothetical protein